MPASVYYENDADLGVAHVAVATVLVVGHDLDAPCDGKGSGRHVLTSCRSRFRVG